jgi:hypothetical protein
MTRLPSLYRSLAALLSCSVWLACSGAASPPDASTPQGTNECSAIQQRASKQVLDVAHAESSRTCSTDQDCTVVSIGGKCFDNCTRAVSASGATLVKAAIDSANANECPAYEQNGCKLIHPPCVPPAAPTCKAGLCE